MTYWNEAEPFGGYPDAPPVSYGAPTGHANPPSAGRVNPEPDGPTNPLAVLSIVFAFIVPPAGAALGHVALWQIKKHHQPGRRLAVLGTAASYVMTLLLIVALVVWLTASGDEPTPPPAAAPTTSLVTAPTNSTVTSTVMVATGRLGIQIQTSKTGIVGAQVVSVLPGAAAGKAGIHAGDTLTAIDLVTVTTSDAVVEIVGKHQVGDTVIVNWTDTAGQQHAAVVTLGR